MSDFTGDAPRDADAGEATEPRRPRQAPWRYLTAALGAVRGGFRESAEDFAVEELPLFEPSGEGEHLHLSIRKRGVTTAEVIDRLARGLGVDRREIGSAGLKDKHAVAVQSLSVPRATEEAVRALELPGVELLSARHHPRKLRRAQCAGNRFELVLRGLDPGEAAQLEAIVRVLEAGLPNYFGEQRFGTRGVNHCVGAALLAEDWTEAVAWIAGRPLPVERDARAVAARERFDAGDYEAAASTYPPALAAERRLAQQLGRKPDARRALRSLPGWQRELYLSAFQSYLFNRQLEDALDEVAPGPTHGQLPGWKTLADEQLRPAQEQIGRCLPAGADPIALLRALKLEGERRRLRLAISVALEHHGDHARLRFELPRGSYATAVVRELFKDDAPIIRLERSEEPPIAGATAAPGNPQE